MGRKPRLWTPGEVYHVTGRGNQKAELFLDDHDYEVFLRLLVQTRSKYPHQLYAYCLMSNHYHLMISSDADVPLSKVMAHINKGFANYFNTRYGLTGHVFEKRYYSKSVAEGHGLAFVSRYIHLNPVRANLAAAPEDYPWSSYHQYIRNPSHPHEPEPPEPVPHGPVPELLCPVDISRVLTIYGGNPDLYKEWCLSPPEICRETQPLQPPQS